MKVFSLAKMPSTLVAVLGEDGDAEQVVFKSLRDFPSEKVILITEQQFMDKANRLMKDLSRLGIESEYQKVKSIKSMEELFVAIKGIKERENGVIINIDADYMSSCLALSAAFVNGIQAIGLMEEKLIAYPIMKFSYYTALSDKKMAILKKIHGKGHYDSLESLGKELRMNIPLTAYHVKGAIGKPGLEEMGLVNTERKGRKLKITLSKLGELLIRGTIDHAIQKKRF